MSRDANVLAQAISRRRLFVYLGTGVGLSLMAACQSAPSTPAAPAAPAAKAPAPPAPAPAAPAPAPAAPAAAPAPAASPAVKAPAATGGGSLAVAFSTEPDTFDAPDVVGSIGGWFLVNFFDGLTQTGPDMSVRPGLAESWSPSSDGLTWTFRLRRGVQFHDGQPFDAEAAKFSLDRHLDPNKPLRRSALFSTVIKSARVVDSGTLELALHRPFAGLPSLLATPYAGLASPKAVQELGQEYPRKPVGTGPFMLKEWVSGQKIVLQRNERYWGGSPALQEVVFQLVPDASTRAALLETGQADIAEHLPPSEMKRLTANPQVVALEADALETREVKFNMMHDLFKDVRVRQAMNHAINVPEIVDAVLSGAGTYTGGPMPKAVPGALVTDKYRYDPAAAKRLLTEAGVPNGFKTELIGTSARGSGIQEMLEAVQAQWRAVGVDATLNIMDTAAFSRLSGTGPEEGKDKQLMSVGLTTIYPDPHASLLLFHSSQWAPKGNNRGFYKNQRVDDLLDQGAAEADATKRAALYREAQELIVNDAPGVFLYTSKLVFGARRNVSGLALLPTATINFAGVSKA